jgi:hypothetical protein
MVDAAKSIGVATPVDVLSEQEFRRGVKRAMTHCKELRRQAFQFLERWFLCDCSYASYTPCFGRKL